MHPDIEALLAIQDLDAEVEAGSGDEDSGGDASALRARRDALAARVPRSVLMRYDRIHDRRRKRVLYPLRGISCSYCDTAIPVQRRTAMARSGHVESCEGCGMLLYATTE